MTALLQAANYGRGAGAIRLVLSTEIANTTAQALYERTGWKRDTFCVYHLTLSTPQTRTGSLHAERLPGLNLLRARVVTYRDRQSVFPEARVLAET